MVVSEIILVGVVTLLVIAAHCWQTVLWEREKRAWRVERARLIDAVLSKNAGDFRVRQTTATTDYEPEPRTAHPNPRPPKPVAIGLDGGSF